MQILRWPRLRFRLACILILSASLLVLTQVKARHRALLLDFGPTNGTFQSFNPLRRLHDGQVMFRDFYPYLGMGPTVTSSLALRLAGDDFAASIYALEMLAGLLHIGSLLLLARLCRMPWLWSLVITAGLVMAGARLCPTIELVYIPRSGHWAATIHGLFFMSQSAIGIRAMAPLLVCLTLFLSRPAASAARWKSWLRDGVPAGLALLWSNDYGIPTFTAYCLLFCLFAPGLSWRERIIRFAGSTSSALIVAVIALTIVTAGQPWNWFQYNAGVAADQFWYYEGRKILRFSEIPFPPFAGVGLIAMLFLAVDLWRVPQSVASRGFLFILVAQFVAAYLSCIGGHIENHYFTAFQRTLTFAAPYGVVRMFAAVGVCLPRLRLAWALLVCWLKSHARVRTLVIITQAMFTYIAIREAQRAYRDHFRYDRLPAHTVHVPELGGHLTEPWSKMVALAREIRDEPAASDEQCRLFSTYATAFEPIANVYQPTGHDYIIHGLGPRERQRYLDVFHRLQPRHVVTQRRDVWQWERWARSVHWDFYRELFREYEPFDRTLYHLVWNRRAVPREFPPIPVNVHVRRLSDAEVQLDVALPADASLDTGEHYVEIEIEAAGSWRTRRFWNSAWRQRLAVLDPTKQRLSFTERFAIPLDRPWRFPVLVKPSQSMRVLLQLGPEEHCRLEIRHLAARYVLPALDIDHRPLQRLRAACVDSGPWQHGIRHTDEGHSIVCVSDPTDLKDLRPGQNLEFAHSGQRAIFKIDYNHIYLAGPPLDAERDGYPAVIRVKSQ